MKKNISHSPVPYYLLSRPLSVMLLFPSPWSVTPIIRDTHCQRHPSWVTHIVHGPIVGGPIVNNTVWPCRCHCNRPPTKGAGKILRIIPPTEKTVAITMTRPLNKAELIVVFLLLIVVHKTNDKAAKQRARQHTSSAAPSLAAPLLTAPSAAAAGAATGHQPKGLTRCSGRVCQLKGPTRCPG